jgi:hypothetical protein
MLLGEDHKFMKKIYVLVEGQTESKFVNELLNLYLNPCQIYLTPVIVHTRTVRNASDYKGGVSSYPKVKNDLKKLFRDSSVDIFTTMFDYYKLPHDFPGYNNLPCSSDYSLYAGTDGNCRDS